MILRELIYKCKKEIATPPLNFIKCNNSDEFKDKIEIDACLKEEIEKLWSKGIKTCGCCCGHGRNLGFIQVSDENIESMKKLGYTNYIYPIKFGGSDRKDAFIPMMHSHIYDGYSKWHLG